MSYKRKKIIKALREYGYDLVREGKKHSIYGNPEGRKVPVPRHTEITPKVARAIADEMGMDWKEFQQKIR